MRAHFCHLIFQLQVLCKGRFTNYVCSQGRQVVSKMLTYANLGQVGLFDNVNVCKKIQFFSEILRKVLYFFLQTLLVSPNLSLLNRKIFPKPRINFYMSRIQKEESIESTLLALIYKKNRSVEYRRFPHFVISEFVIPSIS